ncbi:MAG: 16S rRNA (uracil(1498)-N(3))-methyltransferase [Rickettsiales bacterium]|nr:16S rRNA (uracil(1498)-N(3))-methyltransferase [Rickettsiales bacterium]
MRYHKVSRLFVAVPLSINQNINLTKEQSHYLANVMRKKIGDDVILFNSSDGEFLAKIFLISKNNCELNVAKKLRDFYQSPNLTLVFSPVKSVKPEFIIQKATELGVRKIIPCIFKNTIKEGANLERLKAIAIEAAEQCERLDIPDVSSVIEFEKLFKTYQENSEEKIFILCDETGKGGDPEEVLSNINQINKNLNQPENIIFIGAEGGFDKSEIDAIYKLKNSFGIGLGARILKAETAIISAISIWQLKCGDFNQKPDFRS